MKTDNHNQQQEEALAKYLCGEMSETELRAFEEEIAFSEENKISIKEMKKNWSSLEGYKEPKLPDTYKAWDKLHNRLTEEELIPHQLKNAKRTGFRMMYRVAAVIIILIGVGAVVYNSLNRNAINEMVQINTSAEDNTRIKTLTDGSIIYIAQNSLFSFPKEFDDESRNVALKGEAFFDIMPNPDKPFIIETDEALIQVLGTAFNVKTQNGSNFELFVERGKVKVTLKNNPDHSELVVAGEKITTLKNNLVKSKNASTQNLLWYKQGMHFKDESLQDIVNVLNRNFNSSLVVKENETGNRKLTVTFKNETVETMTELICVTLNLKSQKINGSVILSENKENSKHN